MDTLLILRDTIANHVVKVIDSCQPCIQEAETNWADVVIVKYICLAIVVVSFMFAVACYLCQKEKYKYLTESEDKKREHELKKADKEAEIMKKEKDDELKRYIAKGEFDSNKEQIQKINRTDYERAGEFFKQICDATKDKEYKLDNTALYNLLNFFCEEWRGSRDVEGKNGNTNDKSRSQHEEENK